MEQIQEQLIDWLSPRQSTGAQTTTAIGTAKSESSNGSVLVEFNVEVISDDQSASYDSSTNMAIVELPTTVYCQEGDQVIISLYGEDGVKKPTVTGVSGGGDKMNERIEALEEGGGGGSYDDYFFRGWSSTGSTATTSSWIATKANTRQEWQHPSLEFNEDNFTLWDGPNKELDFDLDTKKLSTDAGLALFARDLRVNAPDDSNPDTVNLNDDLGNYAFILVIYSAEGQEFTPNQYGGYDGQQTSYYSSTIFPGGYLAYNKAVLSIVVPDEQTPGDDRLATKRMLIGLGCNERHQDVGNRNKIWELRSYGDATETPNTVGIARVIGLRMKPNDNWRDPF